MTYIVKGSRGVHTVGVEYPPNGTNSTWVPLKDCASEDEALRFINWLNGGDGGRFVTDFELVKDKIRQVGRR